MTDQEAYTQDVDRILERHLLAVIRALAHFESFLACLRSELLFCRGSNLPLFTREDDLTAMEVPTWRTPLRTFVYQKMRGLFSNFEHIPAVNLHSHMAAAGALGWQSGKTSPAQLRFGGKHKRH